MIRLLYIYFICLLPYISTAWDASVSVTNGIHLVKENDSSLVLVQKLDLNGSYREHTRPLVHDPKRDFLYISGAIQKNATYIYRINIRTKQQDVLVINDSYIPGKMEGKILGIEHDYVKNILYWSNGSGGKILKLDLNSSHLRQTLLHDTNVSFLSTSGLALDECSRTLFWTSYIVREGKGFIESSKLDGSSRVLLHHKDLHSPSDITVDHQAKKIYWCDIKAGLSYSIERSNFDGSSREPILKGSSGVEPISIANTAKYIYWINYNTGNVERVEKNQRRSQQDKIFDYVPNEPRSIVSRKLFQGMCEDIDFKSIQPDSTDITPEDAQNKYLSHSTSYEISDTSRTCLNGGYPERKDTTESNDDVKCKCPSKFHGQQCEKCEYCLNGRCSAGKDGSISCICDKGFSGLRCEHSVCFNYCLNGGQCSVGNHSEPICNCKNSDDSGNFHGPRCEINCHLFCQNNPRFIIVDTGKTICSCGSDDLYGDSMDNVTSNKLVNETCENLQTRLVFGLIGTGILCVILTISTVYLGITVHKLRKRPRIKKRIIVNKNITPTPLTSRPLPIGEQCEITIENCCNMNICETPCYEPQLRASDKSLSKTEEKKNLLKNMEEGEIVSPSQDNLY